MDVTITSIKLKNFRSVVEAELNFDKNGMLLLTGPSGAGKSTINLSIAYALGFCDVPQNQLERWGSKDPMSVELNLMLDGHALWIHRGTDYVGCADQKPMDEGRIGGAIHGAKNVNARLEYLLKLDPEMLSALTYRPQQEPGAFIRKTDAEKKEFLTKVLKLDKFEALVDQTTSNIKVLENKLEMSQLSVSHLVRAVEDAKHNLINPPNTAEVDSLQEELQKARAQQSQIANRLLAISKNQNLPTEILEKIKARDSASKYLDEAIKQDETKNTQFQIEKRRKRQLLDVFKNKEYGFNTTAKRLQDLSGFRHDQCPTCEQEIRNPQVVAKIQAELDHLKSQPTKFTNKELNDIQTLQEDVLADFTPSPNIEKLRKIHYKLVQEIEEAQRGAKQESIELERQKSDISSICDKIKKHLDSIFLLKQQSEKSEVYLESKRQELNKAQSVGRGFQEELDYEVEFAGLIGNQGFLGSIFEEILQEIAFTTNETLSIIPNVSNVVIEFRTESTTQKGTIKKSIVPYISVGGYTGAFNSVLSGGMKTVVMLAIDLAISKIVARRSGLKPGWLILDEPVDGADVKSREALYELLAKEATERLVIVVDHSITTQGLFNNKIITELTPNGTIYKMSQEN